MPSAPLPSPGTNVAVSTVAVPAPLSGTSGTTDLKPLPVTDPDTPPLSNPLAATASDVVPLKSVKDFGAKGDGIQDDSLAFASALRKRLCIFVPKGTYLLQNSVEVDSGSVCLFGEGIGNSILRSNAAPIPSSSTGRIVSWNMFRLSNLTYISFSGLTIDGQVGNGEVGYVNDGSYTDQQTPIEIYKSSHIVFSNVEFTRFKPSIPTVGAGGVLNPVVSLRYKTGALFIHESTNIRILHSKNTYPAWQEGHAILDSQDIYIDDFESDCGKYGITGNEISSVFQIFGASTYKVRIKNSRLRCFLGSAIVLNGAGNFKILNNTISGIQVNGVSAGEGLNLGEESGKEIYPNYSTVLSGMEVAGNRIRSTSTYAVNFGTSDPKGVIRYRDVTIDRNEINDGYVGIVGSSSERVKIQNNRIRKILRYKGQSNFGSSIVLGNSNGVLIKQNTIDGTERSASEVVGILSANRHAGIVTVETTSPHGFVATQPVVLSGLADQSLNRVFPDIQVPSPTRVSFLQKGADSDCTSPCTGTIANYAESIIGIFTFDSDNVEVKWNVINGPRLYDYLHSSVANGADQNISFVSNVLLGSPMLAIQIGSEKHPVDTAAVHGNSLNGSPIVSNSVHSRHLQE